MTINIQKRIIVISILIIFLSISFNPVSGFKNNTKNDIYMNFTQRTWIVDDEGDGDFCLIQDALDAAKDSEEVMIIGGASFYEQLLPQTDCLYLTYVHGNFEADAWFPEINLTEWQEVNREDHKADEKNAYDYSFVTYQRN